MKVQRTERAGSRKLSKRKRGTINSLGRFLKERSGKQRKGKARNDKDRLKRGKSTDPLVCQPLHERTKTGEQLRKRKEGSHLENKRELR